jgi:hypothetical protein
MLYQFAAAAVLLLHLAFILFALLGAAITAEDFPKADESRLEFRQSDRCVRLIAVRHKDTQCDL